MSKPKKVTSLEQLAELRSQKRAVICKSYCFARYLPAAWMIHLSGEILLRLFTTGMFVYTKKGKSK
jgi:hypothetical protein